MNIRKRSLIKKYLQLVIILLIFKLTPLSTIGPILSSVFIEVIILISLFLVWIFDSNGKIKIKKNFVTYLLLTLVIISFLSSVRIFWGNNINLKEIFNYILYFMIFNCVSIFITKYNFNRMKILNFILKIILFNIVVSLLAYFNENIFQIFNTFFETDKSGTFGSSYQRFAGTFSNPNFYGFFFAVFGNISLGLSTFFREKSYNYMYIIIFLLSGYSVIISGSRSGLITFILLVLCNIVGRFTLCKKISLKYLAALFLLLCFIYIIYFMIDSTDFQNLIGNLNTRFINIENILHNFGGRIAMINNGLDVFKENPIFGVGQTSISIDNQYTRTLMESGLVSFIPFLSLIISISVSNVRLLIVETKYQTKVFPFVVFLFCFALIFNMFGAAIFSVSQLTAIFFFVLALNY